MFAPLVPKASVLFVSASSIESDIIASYNLNKRVEAVRGCRNIGKRDMKFNDTMPSMRVDPESYTVEADGVVCEAEPLDTLPLSQTYFAY